MSHTLIIIGGESLIPSFGINIQAITAIPFDNKLIIYETCTFYPRFVICIKNTQDLLLLDTYLSYFRNRCIGNFREYVIIVTCLGGSLAYICTTMSLYKNCCDFRVVDVRPPNVYYPKDIVQLIDKVLEPLSSLRILVLPPIDSNNLESKKGESQSDTSSNEPKKYLRRRANIVRAQPRIKQEKKPTRVRPHTIWSSAIYLFYYLHFIIGHYNSIPRCKLWSIHCSYLDPFLS